MLGAGGGICRREALAACFSYGGRAWRRIFGREGDWRRPFAGRRSLAAQFWLGKALGGTLFAWRQSLVARFWEGVALAAHCSLGDGGDRRRSFRRRRRRGLAAQFWAMAELGDTFFMWRPSLAPQFWRGCVAWRRSFRQLCWFSTQAHAALFVCLCCLMF